MQALSQGQFVKHFQYGLGVVTQSDAERTSIDFYLHGPKKFATELMVVELTDEAPPPKPRPAKRRRASTQLPPVTISASGSGAVDKATNLSG
ncbi:MAG TPA: hypothetical protein VFD30_12215 [Terriglobia bacterium]|jgi:hypothetical protein|nr:hypothetical protein [Terriglobia bacterium]